MKRTWMIAGLVFAAVLASVPAFAGDMEVRISGSIWIGNGPMIWRPYAAPVVYQPWPVYVPTYQPPVYRPQVYHPPVYQPQVYQPQVCRPPVAVYQPVVVSPPAYRPPIVFTYPTAPVSVWRPSSIYGPRRDDDSFRHGHWTYEPVTRPGGSVWYRKVYVND